MELLEQDEIFQALSTLEQAMANNRKDAEKRNGERFLAFCVIAKADYKRYGDLRKDLENECTKGNDQCPKTVDKALHLLSNYKTKKSTNNNNSNTGNKNNNKKKGSEDDSSQMTFAQTEEWHKNAKCHNCGKKGHIRPNCPDLDKNKKATTNANVDSNDKNEKDEDSGKKVTFDKNTKKGSTNVNIGKADDDTCDNCGGFSFLNHTVLP